MKTQSGEAAERAETITRSEKRHKSAVFQPVFLYPGPLFKYKVKFVRSPPLRKRSSNQRGPGSPTLGISEQCILLLFTPRPGLLGQPQMNQMHLSALQPHLLICRAHDSLLWERVSLMPSPCLAIICPTIGYLRRWHSSQSSIP